MTKTPPQKSALLALARLDWASPDFTGSDEVRAALQGIDGYLESWVRPHLLYAAGEPEGYSGEREDLRRDVKLQGARIAAARKWREGAPVKAAA